MEKFQDIIEKKDLKNVKEIQNKFWNLRLQYIIKKVWRFIYIEKSMKKIQNNLFFWNLRLQYIIEKRGGQKIAEDFSGN